MYKAGEAVPLIDVRTPEEFKLIHFKGAINIPEDQAASRAQEFAGKPWVLYCRTGRRAGEVAKMLQDKGMNSFRLLEGGIAQLPMFLKQHSAKDPDATRALQKNIVASIPAIGFPIPDFEIKTAKGKPARPLAEFRNKTIIILSWKPGDTRSETALQQAAEFANKNQGVALVPIPAPELDAKTVEASLKKAGYKGMVYLDPLGETAKALNAAAAPTFIVVDKDGILRAGAFSDFNEPMITQGKLSIAQIAEQARDGKPMRFPDSGLYAEKHDPNELMGQQAPVFSLPDADGKTHALADALARKPAVLVFFTLGCPHSRNMLLKLVDYELVNAAHPKFEIIAVSPDSGPEYRAQMHQFASLNKIQYPIVYDPSGDVLYQYFVGGVPQWVVVDKKGVIRHVAVGYSGDTDKILDDLYTQFSGQ